jgi:hypothetical protein
MSLRYLYRKLPPNQRVCYTCDQPIIRNIALGPDGELYHYGCREEERAKTFHCSECFSTLSGLETRWTEEDGVRTRVCGNCGNSDLTTEWEERRFGN